MAASVISSALEDYPTVAAIAETRTVQERCSLSRLVRSSSISLSAIACFTARIARSTLCRTQPLVVTLERLAHLVLQSHISEMESTSRVLRNSSVQVQYLTLNVATPHLVLAVRMPVSLLPRYHSPPPPPTSQPRRYERKINVQCPDCTPATLLLVLFLESAFTRPAEPRPVAVAADIAFLVFAVICGESKVQGTRTSLLVNWKQR